MTHMQEFNVPTSRGTVLNSVRFSAGPQLPPSRTALIIGSYSERFRDTDEDVAAYVHGAHRAGYEHIVLGGHSLGANKVIHYLAAEQHEPVDHFFLLSPANVTHMTSVVPPQQRRIIERLHKSGRGSERLPFDLLGWLPCTADTGWDWVFSDILNNVHTKRGGDYAQTERIQETGALLIGTYDNFTDGDPAGFLRNINDHIPTAPQNDLLLIEGTGHTYQHKHQETADAIASQMDRWYAHA